MTEIEISNIEFYRMFKDVEKIKYEFDASWLNCCLNSNRLLIIGSHEIICEKKFLLCDNAYYGIVENKDTKQKNTTYAFPSDECIWCEMVQPIVLKKEGNYRSVKPRRLLQAIDTVQQLMKKEEVLNKRILIGMDEKFYIKLKGTGENYDQIASLLFDYDPDIIFYQENGCVNVEWKICVTCS